MLAARGPRRQIRLRSISSRRSGSQPSDIAVDARVRVPTDSLKLKRIDIKVSRPPFSAGGKRRRRFGRARVTISPSHRRECPWSTPFSSRRKRGFRRRHRRFDSLERRLCVASATPGARSQRHFDPGKYGFLRCHVLWRGTCCGRDLEPSRRHSRPSQGVCVMLYAAISSAR